MFLNFGVFEAALPRSVPDQLIYSRRLSAEGDGIRGIRVCRDET